MARRSGDGAPVSGPNRCYILQQWLVMLQPAMRLARRARRSRQATARRASAEASRCSSRSAPNPRSRAGVSGHAHRRPARPREEPGLAHAEDARDVRARRSRSRHPGLPARLADLRARQPGRRPAPARPRPADSQGPGERVRGTSVPLHPAGLRHPHAPSESAPTSLQASGWVGRETPAYCTSVGQVLLLDEVSRGSIACSAG